MARGFSLTAEINLRGPTNIRPIVNNIRRQLGSINANVNLNINRATLGSINQINTRLGNLNATLAATTTATTSAAQAFTNLATAMRSVGSVNLPQTVQAPMVRLTASANNATTAVARTRTEFEDFGRQAGLAVRRFAAFSAVTSVIYGFSNALSAGIKQYIEFDRQITRLSQVTNESKASLSSMTSEITRLSTTMGVASEDLAQVSVILAQAGFTASETRKALEALAKSALAPSFDDLNQTVEGSIALMRQFGITANQLEGALGSINAVAAGFAVEASDLIAAIQRTGGVFASASRGVSSGTDALNEFLAVFTSVRATTRESAETIATGLRTIFTRIQRSDTIEALKEYGVSLTDLEGKFVGPYIAVQRLAEGLGRLDPRDLKFSEIVEELGGFRQIGKVLPLIQQFATAQDALKIAQQGQGSLAADAAKGQLALAIQIQKVREEFTALVRSVGDSDGFKTMVRLGLDLASALIKIADATKGVLPLVGIMAAFRGVSAITQFAGGFGGGFRGTRDRRASQGGRIYGFASGGVVPGSGRGDKIPALLEPGEVVMSNRAVSKYGRGNLVKMNKYAGGGLNKPPHNTVSAWLEDKRLELAHMGDILPINEAQLSKYLSRSSSATKSKSQPSRSIKFDRQIDFLKQTYGDIELSEIINKLQLSQAQPFLISLPRLTNQELRNTSGSGVVKDSLTTWMKQNPSSLFAGKRRQTDRITLSKLKTGVAPGYFANELANYLDRSISANIIYDQDIKGVTRGISHLLTTETLENLSKRSDIIWRNVVPSPVGVSRRTQERQEGTERLMSGGKVQRFMSGGGVKSKPEPFGTGTTKFPRRISNAYAKQMEKEETSRRFDMMIQRSPINERIMVDEAMEQQIAQGMRQPLDREQFAASFRRAVLRDEIASNISNFAKLVGLPQEDLSVVLPRQLDFGSGSGPIGSRGGRDVLGGAFTTISPYGSRGAEGWDLSEFGYTKQDEQDLFGLEKLLEEKKKERDKIRKTPTRTFDDGSFSYDLQAADKARDEYNALNQQIYDIRTKRDTAISAANKAREKEVASSGRATLGFGTRFGKAQNPVFYHELTHQLFKGLRAKSADSFDKYKQRVTTLFETDNDGLADAFDALNAGYSSADVVYGRAYKLDLLGARQREEVRTNPSGEDVKNLSSLIKSGSAAKKATEFRPINPDFNSAMLKFYSQEHLDKVEDNGKEEFLTTLVEKMPVLDQRLQGILDSTMTELLGGAGITRQQYATGGVVQRFVDGGWVERMKKQPAQKIKDELEVLESAQELFGFQRKVMVGTFRDTAPFGEDVGAREVRERIASINEFLASQRPQKKESAKKKLSLPKPPSNISDYLKSLIENDKIHDITSEYGPYLKNVLNEAYRGNLGPGVKQEKIDKVGPKSIVSFIPGESNKYIDAPLGVLENDLKYISKVRELQGQKDEGLKATRSYSISDMLDSIRAFQAMGLDAVMNIALGHKMNLEQPLADVAKLSKSDRKKLGPAVNKPLSGFVGSIDAAMQHVLPDKLYTGLGKSKQQLLIDSSGVEIDKLTDTKKLVGKTVSMPSFLSTSEVPIVASRFDRTGIMTIETNKKNKGLNTIAAKEETINRDKSKVRKSEQRLIAEYTGAKYDDKQRADEDYADDYDTENEYILPRNSKFKVKSIEARDDRDKDGESLLDKLAMNWDVKLLNRGGVVQEFADGGDVRTIKTRKQLQQYLYGKKSEQPDTLVGSNVRIAGRLRRQAMRKGHRISNTGYGAGDNLIDGFDPMGDEGEYIGLDPSGSGKVIDDYLYYNLGGPVQRFAIGGKTKPQKEIFSSSPTPMLKAILANIEKKPIQKEYSFRSYQEELSSVLNQAYKGILMGGTKPIKEKTTRDSIVSMPDQYSNDGRYIDVTVGALEDDLKYITGGDTEKGSLKKRKGVEVGDMLDVIRSYQALGLDYTLNAALATGRTNETLGEFQGTDLSEVYKTAGLDKVKLSTFVKQLDAAAQFKFPEKLYSGLGDSKLDLILKDTNTKNQKDLDNIIGKTFTMPSFLSSSDAEELAMSFARVGMLTILTNPKRKGIIPEKSKQTTINRESQDERSKKSRILQAVTGQKGFAGFEIDEMYADNYDSEGEYIFPSNSKFRINSIDKRTAKLFDKDAGYKHLDMEVQQLAKGGVAQRKVGYIDYDVIANPANESAIKRGMEETGVTGPRLYTDHLTQLAVKARKDSSLQKLRAVYGVAGSGKTTLARGQGTDDAKLRKTERFPILSPQDIQRATEVIVLSSSVSKDKLDSMFDATDRTYALSSTTKEEKDRVRSQRGIRDTTGVGLEGRKPGSTASVSTDTAVGEALLADRLGDRSVVLGRSGSGRTRRKQGNELVEVIKKKIGFTWGGYSPMTAGHESIMDAASAMGIPPEDFIYLVGSNEGIIPGKEDSYRTAIFDQDTRMILAQAGAGAKGATVLRKPRDFEVPQAFDISEPEQRRRVIVPAKGSATFVADKTLEETEKYKKAGYKVHHIERTGGISGTMVRKLIQDGNLGELQKVLSPGVYDLISNNIGRIQNRANIIPSLIQETQQTQGVKLADIEKQIKAVGITKIVKSKLDDPEYAAKVEVLTQLREKRDQIKSSASFEPHRLLAALAAKEPGKYGLDFNIPSTPDIKPVRTVQPRTQKANIGGLIQKFMAGSPGGVSEIKGTEQSLLDNLATRLKALGGESGLRELGVGIPLDLQKKVRTNLIKEGVLDTARVTGLIERAEAIKKRRQDEIDGTRHVAMAGLQPLDYNWDPEWELDDGRKYIATIRGFKSSYLQDIERFRERQKAAALDFAKDTTATEALGLLGQKTVQGPPRSLAIDFDDTLAFGTKMLDSSGKEDISAYYDEARVREVLSKATPTRLAQRLAEIEKDQPGTVRAYTRVLTARAESLKHLVTETLNRFGLPYTDSDITGVGQKGDNDRAIARKKGDNLRAIERFIDDSEKNISVAQEKGIQSYRYSEPKAFENASDYEPFGAGNIEGALLEQTLAMKIGRPIDFEALEQNRALDFPNGLGAAASLFGLPPNIETEVKRTLNKDSFTKARSEFNRYFKENPDKYNVGGIVASFAKGGKADYYSLEKSSGLSSGEFDGMVRYAKTNDFSLNEFKTYLSKRTAQKQSRVGSVIDPRSLQSFLMHGAVGPRLGTGDLTEEQKKLAEMLKGPPDPQYDPSRFASGGTVPALVSNGEAYVPPKLAKRIGYGKLNRMNQADRNGMGRFSEGGISVFKGPGTGTSDSIPTSLPVGSFILREKATKALGFNRGGSVGVQRFFFGGRSRGPAPRPETISADTIGAATLATSALSQLAEVLTELGVSGSESARLLGRGYQATAAEAARAAQSDLNMARAAGAGADVLFDLERAVQRATEAQDRQLALMQQLGDVSGDVIQDAIDVAEEQIRNLRQDAETLLRSSPSAGGTARTDEEVEDELRAGEADRRRAAYATAAGTVGVALGAANATGDDLANVLNNISRDARTLEQMNARLLENRKKELSSTAAFKSASVTQQQRMLREVERLANEEIRVRSRSIQQAAEARGETGPNDNPDRNMTRMASFAVITVGSMIATNLNVKSSATNAGIAAGIQSGSSTLGTGLGFANEIAGVADTVRNFGGSLGSVGSKLLRFGSNVTFGIAAVAAVVDAFNSYQNAVEQFYIDLAKQRLDASLSGFQEELDRVTNNVKKLPFDDLNSKIESAGERYVQLLDRLGSQTTASWSNLLDRLRNALGITNIDPRTLSKESRIRELAGSSAADRAAASPAALAVEYEAIIPQLAQEQAALGKAQAEAALGLLRSRIQRGESAEDIIDSSQFESISNILANSNQSLREQLLRIENLDEDDATIASLKKELIEQYGKERIILEANIVTREKDSKSMSVLTNVYTRSLSRMFENMSQAINSTNFALQSLTDNADLTAKALSGQAQAGGINLRMLDVLKNPRGYSSIEQDAARTGAAGFFGTRADVMPGLGCLRLPLYVAVTAMSFL